MLGLGDYESSSEDEVERKGPSPKPQRNKDIPPTTSQASQNEGNMPLNSLGPTRFHVATDSVPEGPVLGPASIDMAPLSEDKHLTSGRSSPFSASRALVQDLTLPLIPNLDIPPSPPGSPNPAANAKFEHFLSLKKQGVHFNSKLASSSSLKNPSLLKKMMEHAGINEQSQYDTSLPADLWNPSNLPNWGFKEELLRTQQDFRKQSEEKKASGQRSSVDFVTGSA
ncbi:HCNGP-like [Penicillium camemberti]|uniref:HCNGP-like n=1 Tax=Penicillium camemberti (strain FM 013) TaxID=1429867 RepID=A0A0G4PKZ4_PENC3|nr:HCNGP-like [Penicillium camemberti]